MSTTFLGILIASAFAIAYWRLTLLILTAVLIALLATGLSALADGIQSGPALSSAPPAASKQAAGTHVTAQR